MDSLLSRAFTIPHTFARMFAAFPFQSRSSSSFSASFFSNSSMPDSFWRISNTSKVARSAVAMVFIVICSACFARFRSSFTFSFSLLISRSVHVTYNACRSIVFLQDLLASCAFCRACACFFNSCSLGNRRCLTSSIAESKTSCRCKVGALRDQRQKNKLRQRTCISTPSDFNACISASTAVDPFSDSSGPVSGPSRESSCIASFALSLRALESTKDSRPRILVGNDVPTRGEPGTRIASRKNGCPSPSFRHSGHVRFRLFSNHLHRHSVQ
jgi:hypothetical protein